METDYRGPGKSQTPGQKPVLAALPFIYYIYIYIHVYVYICIFIYIYTCLEPYMFNYALHIKLHTWSLTYLILYLEPYIHLLVYLEPRRALDEDSRVFGRILLRRDPFPRRRARRREEALAWPQFSAFRT